MPSASKSANRNRPRLRLLLRRLMISPTSGCTLQASFFVATDWSGRRPGQTFETSKARRVPSHENVAED